MKKATAFLFLYLLLFSLGACQSVEEQKPLSKPVAEKRVLLMPGQALEGLSIVGEDGPYYCNLVENLTGVNLYSPEDFPVLVCKDPVYGITYYVNYGRDFFLYARRGAESTCVLEIPARDIYCLAGNLYFRAEDYNIYAFDSFADGAVLVYHPVDGSVEVVIDEPTFEMAVYPDGIFYVVNEEYTAEDGTIWGTRHQYFYSFETKESREFEGPMRVRTRWKDCYLVADENGDGYWRITQSGDKAGRMPEWIEFPPAYQIREEGIYYIDSGENALMYYNIASGERETLAALAMTTTFPDTFLMRDDIVYFSNGLRYSLGERKQDVISFPENEVVHIEGVYTDGADIYILADGRLWLYEEKKTGNIAYELSTIPGRTYRVGGYEAKMHPLGE